MIFENEKEMEHIYSLLDDMAIVKPNKSSKLEEARDYDLLSQPMNCNGLYYCEREEVNLKIDLYESAIKELQDEIVLLKQDKNDLSLAHEEEIKQMINTYNVGMEENLKQYEDLIKEMEDENKGLKQQIDGFKNNE
jgi:serine/threonine protein kinase